MKTLIHAVILFLSVTLIAQNKLILHTESVDSLLVWMQNGCNKNCINYLCKQPAAQLMEQILKSNEKNVPEYKNILINFNYNDSTSGSKYILNKAYKNRNGIYNLTAKIKESDFSEKVYKRTVRYFPDNYSVPENYEVFFTAVGWQWGDAMSFDYNYRNGEYLLSDSGTPAIMFNLTLVSSLYGKTTSEQMEKMENVMSHELFHAILSDYIKANWKNADSKDVNYNTLFLMLNEGLAHYIADCKTLQDGYLKDFNLKQKEMKAFATLSDSAKVIFNTNNKYEVRSEALNSGLYGKYWNKYVCIAGLFMIYHIEQKYGMEEIKECIKNGPSYFIRKYETLRQTDSELPELPNEIVKFANNCNSSR